MIHDHTFVVNADPISAAALGSGGGGESRSSGLWRTHPSTGPWD